MKKLLIALLVLTGYSTGYAYPDGKYGVTTYGIILAPMIQSHQFEVQIGQGDNGPYALYCLISGPSYSANYAYLQGNVTTMSECNLVRDPNHDIGVALALNIIDLTNSKTGKFQRCQGMFYKFTEKTKNLPQIPHTIMISEHPDGTIVCAMIQ